MSDVDRYYKYKIIFKFNQRRVCTPLIVILVEYNDYSILSKILVSTTRYNKMNNNLIYYIL